MTDQAYNFTNDTYYNSAKFLIVITNKPREENMMKFVVNYIRLRYAKLDLILMSASIYSQNFSKS